MKSTLLLPEGATVAGPALGAFVNDTTRSLQALTITAPKIILHELALDHLFVDTASEDLAPYRFMTKQYFMRNHTEHQFTNARITLETIDHRPQFHPGWLGYYPTLGATATLNASRALDVHALDNITIAHPTVPRESAPEHDYFEYAPNIRTHILATGGGTITTTGGGVLKMMGPEIVVESDQGVFTFRSGSCCTGQAGQGRDRLITIDMHQEGDMQLVATHGANLLLETANAVWNGPSKLRSANATLRSDTNSYSGEGDVELDGAFQASIHPIETKGGGMVSVVQIVGDLRDTSLTSSRIQILQRLAEGRALDWLTLTTPTLLFAVGGVIAHQLLMRRKERLTVIDYPGMLKKHGREDRANYVCALHAKKAGRFDLADHYLALALEQNPALFREAQADGFRDARYSSTIDKAAERFFETPTP